MTDIIDATNRRWSVRRTCTDKPGRAYHIQLIDDIDDVAEILPGVVGFYAESIDDARHRLCPPVDRHSASRM